MQAAVLAVARINAEARLRYYEQIRRASDWQTHERKLCELSFRHWVDAWLTTTPADLGPQVGAVPWVLWPAQIEATDWDFRAMVAGGPWKRRKARRTGETTRQMALCYWLAAMRGARVTVASRTMTQVDVLGDEETLFGILREIHLCQPDWMRPKLRYDKMGVMAFGSGGQIVGLSTHRQTGRSRRSYYGLLDESEAIESNKLRGAFAALKGACTTLLMVGNPNPDRKHYSKAVSRDIGEHRIHQVSWTGDPFRLRGPGGSAWYEYTKSTMREVDAAAEYLADENAVYDGKLVWDISAWQIEDCPDLYRQVAKRIGGLDYGGGGESLSACAVSVHAEEEMGWRAWIDFAWQSGDDIRTAPRMLRDSLSSSYPAGVTIYGDPTGDARDKQGEEIRQQWIRHSGGLAILSAPYIANTAEGRHSASKWADKQARAGRLKISPRALPLIKWMMDGQRYEERKTWEEEQEIATAPVEGMGSAAPRMEKGIFSHLSEAVINDIIELRRRVDP